MAKCNTLFTNFNNEIKDNPKKEALIKSKNNIRDKIKSYFKKEHPNYIPDFWIQGSYKMGTLIRYKDDTCDLDYGVYFKSNPDNVSAKTLQTWVKNAVINITKDIIHKEKCITINYKGDYNIDLPIYLFDKENEDHPYLAIKENGFSQDDPKEMVDAFNNKKDSKNQLLRIVRYLKAWCDNKSPENGTKMPSGLAMTILAMNNFQSNDNDDVALKYTLINIKNSLGSPSGLMFTCIVPATPHDNIFKDYSLTKKTYFDDNLSRFIDDARKAVDEKNQLIASELWRKHLGNRFPKGDDRDEEYEIKDIKDIATKSSPYARI